MNQKIACRVAFSEALLEEAKKDKDVIVVTTDARGSASVDNFARELPEQFVEVGIAEQNAVGVAAGLSICGFKPFVCGPACFLSARSFEQVKVDVAYSKTNVKIIGVSGGVSYGPLGGTHHAFHDIAAFRAVPNMTVILPSDANLAKAIARTLVNHRGPVYVRMGRNPVPVVYSEEPHFEIGKANVLLEGDDIAIVACGEVVKNAFDAALLLREKGIYAKVVDMHTLKPIDEELIIEIAKKYKVIFTVEEHNTNGGLGDAVAGLVAKHSPKEIVKIALPDEDMITGSQFEIYDYYGLSAEKIVSRVLSEFERR
ncbi:Transketolase central region [Caldicellulosiruptor owensensis OL]|uniref:Transketolase central region n=1 Tax=Caldicellulosiruptor owensensis (strain ATCC 700167 / DSM 13100 / OL) TaxID=632518 RepID=E4Q3F8_CALOW|nr:transketolase C-terminal domain-containing protein [Caldicellulosiruptor owensensis]ADQ03918.1 Transketolase central region [Caldicellulosiruptor owensensis OL]